ncbi:Kinesin-like protein KIP2 [Nakaseomyces bracarensis]|uniref:Kinesin-like protein KIP2 n=1 Tax=Nakaseomyces bracarensis TaxID=273131 RepID=A0ABR4NTZ6_9SACH
MSVPRVNVRLPNSSTPTLLKSPSPSLDSAVSFSSTNRRKGSVIKSGRNGSISSSSTRSSSPIRAGSLMSDPYFQFSKIRNISDSSSNSSSFPETYTGTINVVIRPKPYPKNKLVSWKVLDRTTVTHDDIGDFNYDHVFSVNSSNAEVYEATSVPLIDKLIDGYNATIFAYGMTGSGKTFTMSGTEDEQGIIPLSISYLFNRLAEEGERNQNVEKYEVALSYLEIYNEKINDLLDNETNSSNMPTTPSRFFTTSHYSNGTKDLKIRDDSQYGVRVVGLSEKRCKDSAEVLEWISCGDKFRKTGETEYNTRSSRSHAIVLLRLTSIDIRTGKQSTRTLSLCDLAGSERGIGQNERRKEGAFINKSLLALGTVISRLSAENTNSNVLMSPGPTGQYGVGSGHIPYRDSKLTRLLQPALSGNSLITALCTIDLRTESNNETLNTLRFANRAKNVSLNVRSVSGGGQAISTTNHNTNAKLEARFQELTTRLHEQEEEIKRLRQTADAGENAPASLVSKENEILRNKLNHYEAMLLHRTRTTSAVSSAQHPSQRAIRSSETYAQDDEDEDADADADTELAEIASLLPPDIGTVLHAKFEHLSSQLRQQQHYAAKLEQQLNEQVNQLTRSLQTKDKLIEALTSAKRLEDA